jgi:hypothetical protein
LMAVELASTSHCRDHGIKHVKYYNQLNMQD